VKITAPKIQAPMSPTTRNKEKEIVRTLLRTIEFDEETIEYLVDEQGIRTPSRIVGIYESEKIESYLKEGKPFTVADSVDLEKLAKYLIWYRRTHAKFENVERLEKSFFDLFDPKNVLQESEMMTRSKELESVTDIPINTIKITVKDFPKFSGKVSDWTKFFEEFTALCELQGMENLLEEDENHKSQFESDENYKKKCMVCILSSRTAAQEEWPYLK
jgi:hypothetical protein